MVTIATFQKEEDAHLEASRLREMGIETQVVHGGGSGWMPYVQSAVELQIAPSDVEKLREHSEEVLSEREHRCPNCGSARYVDFVSFGDHFRAFVTGFTGVFGRGKTAFVGDESFGFRCRDCGTKFRIQSKISSRSAN